ncbi:hypothetical protein GUITHDRAFT_106375 [Guillardia theta CCMP2712]|uniref:PDZ domain-containing protein n=1 Tax=Guillardia theta (strain CCMP2712) TaxID=905079 RepID=L1JHQ1_GUITC|nr:hypothetical protein GUITHDRAFT_106375 [Guillardia theta CCMP2712]EKX47827.1 hypothetical protein GUITHDRAFT_106375 [Guillardia theta CCMP2712]|eukprot:XP_005834807.1 hypothetical protein GUITHDRAFT_106375 [Guillardia theta CCMP2712]
MHKTRQLVVDFESESWGICARLRERDAFAVPIRVSRVKADSEAHAKGVQEGDCIVKLESCGASDMQVIDVEMARSAILFASRAFVSRSIYRCGIL